MKKFTTLLFILINLVLFSEWTEIPENPHNQLFKCVTTDIANSTIQFSLDGYETSVILESGRSFQKLGYQNEGKLLDTGKPDIPTFTRLISIPNTGTISINITSIKKQVISDIDIYPYQGLQSESEVKGHEFIINNQFYQNESIYPLELIEIGEPAIMRDLRVVNITVNPFQYNPIAKQLVIFTNIEFIVNCEEFGGINIKTNDRLNSQSFESTYKSLIINKESLANRNPEYHQPNYLFIFPENSVVEINLQNLIDWKKQKGFHTVAVSTAQTGLTTISIKDYIQDAYDTWENPPEFICLVGDAGGNFSIPTGHINGGPGDHYYVLLEGDDILADAFIGRLSFNTIFELQTIISKILQYEKEPYLENTNWYNKVLLVGDPTVSGQSCIDAKISTREMISQYSNDFSFSEVYSSPWVSQMNNAFNGGVSYFNYRGFYGMSGWENSNINAMNNGSMLPVAVLLTCSVGDFEGTSDSRTECFLKAGTPGNHKGAIAAIGTATSDTNTCFNNCVDAGIYYGIFVDNIYHLGGALNRGKLHLYTSYPSNPDNAIYKFSYWNNLMGDPGMEIWTGIPQQIYANYDSQLPVGSNFLEITVTKESGSPIENSWVTIYREEDIFATGFTDSNGKIFLPINTINPGEVNLTITKHNYAPAIETFEIIMDEVLISVYETEIDDDNDGSSNGNNNNIINPNEDIELGINLKNYSSDVVYNVSATISSENEFITITNDSEYFGDIPANSSLFSPVAFDFFVNPATLDGTEIIIDVLIQAIGFDDWNDKIYLYIEGVNLQPIGYTILDGNNGILEQGETAELVVNIENTGSILATNIEGYLTCSNDQITIIDDYGYFGNIDLESFGSNNSNTFTVSSGYQIIPGTAVSFDLQLVNTEGYDNIITFFLEVGEVLLTDPLGPDEYGYYCYDDEDISYDLAPTYLWIEIDPELGGQGTIIPLYDNGDIGDIEDIDLPFLLQYYGIIYTSITICSNGWIAPGGSESMSFMNWSIPGANGPSPIIAPFWDDLTISDGRVCYFYDENLHYFVIEWSNLQNDYDNSQETFQVILYNSNYYPTETGDSKILFQYETINNVDQGNYGDYSNHGEYATVGLEDHTGTVGLEYTYSNQYPTAAKILENEMAILFSTLPLPLQEPFIIVDHAEFTDPAGNNNENINSGETIEVSISLRNLGYVAANGVTASLSTTDSLIYIIDNLQYYNDIMPNEVETSLGNYLFEVSSSCPDQHIILFDLLITSDGNYQQNCSFAATVLNSVISASTEVIDFEEIFVGYPESKNFTLSNTGSDSLHVTDIFSDNSDFTPDITSFSLDVGESQDVIITVSTNILGIINDTLRIISNDPINSELQISLCGIGLDLIPPNILVSPAWFDEHLIAGEISQQELIIENNGESDLIVIIKSLDIMDAGMSVNFNGDGDYISLGNDSSLRPDFPFSISAWIKILDYSNTIFANDAASSNYYGFWFLANSSNKISLTTGNGGTGGVENRRSYTTNETMIYDTWYHVAAVATSFDNRAIYINGELANCSWSGYATSIGYHGNNARIGRYYNWNYFDGSVDEVRFWNYARSQAEISSSMNSSLTGNEPGLIGYWNFNGVNPLFDVSGNGNDGIPNGNINIIESSAPFTGWLNSNPVFATISPESSLSVVITFDSNGLDIGSYESEILISSNDPDSNEIVIPVSLNVTGSGINDIHPVVELDCNYPNPFNPETTFSFTLQNSNQVELIIFNIKGQKIKTLIDEAYNSGYHSIIWNGLDDSNRPISSGLYMYQIRVNGKTRAVKKCLLLK